MNSHQGREEQLWFVCGGFTASSDVLVQVPYRFRRACAASSCSSAASLCCASSSSLGGRSQTSVRICLLAVCTTLQVQSDPVYLLCSSFTSAAQAWRSSWLRSCGAPGGLSTSCVPYDNTALLETPLLHRSRTTCRCEPHLSLVAFLLEFGPLSAGLLQQGAELPQLLVPVGERGEGLLLQLLCLCHPVHTLQPETHVTSNMRLFVTLKHSSG